MERIGVLGRYAKKFDGTFDQLLQQFKNNYYVIQPAVQEIFKADLIDIGASLDFKTSNSFIKSQAGAMKKKQLQEFFTFEKEPPEVGSYFQIDTFFTPEITPSLSRKEIINLVQEYISDNWTKYNLLVEKITK